MNPNSVHALLTRHLPSPSVEYCYGLWVKYPFDLKTTRGRQTKVGDFSCHPGIKKPTITVNGDLNKYLFLVTYVHEVAHWYVYIKYRDTVEPHGENWKNAFKFLLGPLLTEEVFPQPLLGLLQKHMKSPKASSFADSKLTLALRSFDENRHEQVVLSSLQKGTVFKFNKKYFRKGELQRTRFLCREVKTNREYLVPADVLVEQAQLNFFESKSY